MATVVQFTGIEAVMNAFLYRECKAWSIWVGNQFLFSCVGDSAADAANELETVLTSIEKSGKGIYTLKIYEDLKKNTKITNKTECNGSFNFRLQAFDPERDGSNYYNDLRNEVKELKAQNEQLLQELDEKDDADEEPDMLGKIGNMFLSDPTKLPAFISAINSVLNMFTKQTTVPGQPVAIGNVPGSPDPLTAVIEKLKAKDPKLTEHLTKLASMDDATFKQLLAILDNF